jgi:hypothetical protein
MVYEIPQDTSGLDKKYRVTTILPKPTHLKLLRKCQENNITASRLVRHMVEYCLDGGNDQ